METEIADNSMVELGDVKSVLDSFNNIDDETKNRILEELSEKAQLLKTVLENTEEPKSEEAPVEGNSEKESAPKVKKQWGIILSDPNKTLTQEYMGWCFQMDEDENIADANDKIITAANEFNRSKKGSRNPVKTIGEAVMFVPSKFFKEQKIYMKNKEPVFINVTDNSLISKNS